MKSLVIFVIMVFSAGLLGAKNNSVVKKIEGGIEFRYLEAVSIDLDKMGSLPASFSYGKSLRLNLGYFINPRLYAGVSLGADRYEGYGTNTLPLCLASRYYFKDTRKKFFLFGEVGPNIRFSESQAKGFVHTLGIGYRFRIFKKTKLLAKLGYNCERNPTEVDVWDGNSTWDNPMFTTFDDHISRKSLLFGLGINF